MFNNVGSKIKTLAKVFTWIGIISSCLGGLGIIIMSLLNINYMGGAAALGIFLGLIIAAFGWLLSWLCNLKLYGFGQIVENSDIIARNTEIMARGTYYGTPGAASSYGTPGTASYTPGAAPSYGTPNTASYTPGANSSYSTPGTASYTPGAGTGNGTPYSGNGLKGSLYNK